LVVVICSDWRSKINQADINLLTDISYKLFRQKLRGTNVSYKCVCRLFYHMQLNDSSMPITVGMFLQQLIQRLSAP